MHLHSFLKMLIVSKYQVSLSGTYWAVPLIFCTRTVDSGRTGAIMVGTIAYF